MPTLYIQCPRCSGISMSQSASTGFCAHCAYNAPMQAFREAPTPAAVQATILPQRRTDVGMRKFHPTPDLLPVSESRESHGRESRGEAAAPVSPSPREKIARTHQPPPFAQGPVAPTQPEFQASPPQPETPPIAESRILEEAPAPPIHPPREEQGKKPPSSQDSSLSPFSAPAVEPMPDPSIPANPSPHPASEFVPAQTPVPAIPAPLPNLPNEQFEDETGQGFPCPGCGHHIENEMGAPTGAALPCHSCGEAVVPPSGENDSQPVLLAQVLARAGLAPEIQELPHPAQIIASDQSPADASKDFDGGEGGSAIAVDPPISGGISPLSAPPLAPPVGPLGSIFSSPDDEDDVIPEWEAENSADPTDNWLKNPLFLMAVIALLFLFLIAAATFLIRHNYKAAGEGRAPAPLAEPDVQEILSDTLNSLFSAETTEKRLAPLQNTGGQAAAVEEFFAEYPTLHGSTYLRHQKESPTTAVFGGIVVDQTA